MTTYVVMIEGQSIPVPEEVGVDDSLVRAALAPFFPDVANALITRKTTGETVTVNVVKKAGSKGGNPHPQPFFQRKKGEAFVEALREAPSGQNPAVALYMEVMSFGKLDPVELLRMEGRIQKALESGLAQGEQVQAALALLRKAQAQPAAIVPVGF